MEMKDILSRIRRRLEKQGMKAATASRRATGSPDLIRNWERAIKRGENPGASTHTLAALADVLGTNVPWLVDAAGQEEGEADSAVLLDVPLVSWVTAGQLADQDAIVDLTDFPVLQAVDLPAGDWIALKVERDANSMNKISPPESVIFVNRRDKRLVHNACYVISDERGRVTYKRYRQNEDPVFQPASYDEVEPPKLEGAISIVGRVKRSMIDM